MPTGIGAAVVGNTLTLCGMPTGTGASTASVTIKDSAGVATTKTYALSVTAFTVDDAVAIWPTYESSGTTIHDATANANNMTIGTAGFMNGQSFGNALTYWGKQDNTKSEASAVSSSSLSISGSISLAAWVYVSSFGSGNYTGVLEKGTTGDVYYNLALSPNGGNSDIPTLEIQNGSAVYNTCRDTGAHLSANTWYHLVGTDDGVTMRLYLNGSQIATHASGGSIKTGSASVFAGADQFNNGGGRCLNGSLDHMRIYNRALSAGEVTTLYNAEKGIHTLDTWTFASNGSASGGFFTVKSDFSRNATPGGPLLTTVFLYAPSGPAGSAVTPIGLRFVVGQNAGDLTNFYYNAPIGSGALTTGVDVSSAFANSTTYTVQMITQRSLDGLYLIVTGYVQRGSDSKYLTCNGTWTATKTPVLAAWIVNNGNVIPNDGSWYGTTFGASGYITPGGVTVTPSNFSLTTTAGLAGVSPASGSAPGNEAELIGTITTSHVGVSGHGSSQINSGALSAGNYYLSNSIHDSWVMINLAVAITPTRILYAPGVDLDSAATAVKNTYPSDIEWFGCGLIVQGATSPGGPWTTLGSYTALEFPERFNLNTLALDTSSPGGTYSYIRLYFPSGPACCSLFKVVGQVSGGSLVEASAAVAQSCGWQAGGKLDNDHVNQHQRGVDLLHHGRDDPDVGRRRAAGNDDLYSGAVTIPANQPAETTVQAIAYHASGNTTTSDVVTGKFVVARKYVPDTLATRFGSVSNWPQDWYDDRAVLMECHAGCITVVSTTLYWEGLNFNSAMLSSAANAGPAPRGFNLYSNTDSGYTWHKEAIQLGPPPMSWQATDVSTSRPLGAYTVTERPHTVVNPSPIDSNKKYVKYCHLNTQPAYNSPVVGVATAPAITGPWTWQTTRDSTRFGGNSPRDLSLFYDGTNAYLYYAHNASTIFANKLDSTVDWINTMADAVITVLTGSIGREAPVGFIRSGEYFTLASANTSYGAGNSRMVYVAAATIGGLAAASEATIWASAPSANTTPYDAQSTSVFLMPGISDGYVFVGDTMDANESPVNLYHARLFWEALSFPSGSTISVAISSSFDNSAL
jgi:hypothetical protein